MICNPINVRTAVCTYTILPSGIHEFVFAESSRRSVDIWFEHVHHIYAEAPQDEKLRFLIDTRLSGTLPITYSMQHTRQLFAQFPQRPRSRSAFLHKKDVLLSMVDGMLGTMGLDRLADPLRFFPLNARDIAMDWLLETRS